MKILKMFDSKLLAVLYAVALFGFSAGSPASEFSDGLGGMTTEEIQAELQGLPAEIRSNMNRQQMEMFITNLLIDRRIEAAAIKAGTPELPEVKASIARAERNVVVRAYVDSEGKKLAESLPNLENLARERYEVDKSKYVVPESARLSHILIQVNEEDPERTDAKAKAKAEALLARIRRGEDFGKLAEEFSEDPRSARAKGELAGWAIRGKFVPSFEEAAFALKPGEVSEVVRTRFGYHVILMLEVQPARQQSFEEVKDIIMSSLKAEFLGRERAEWMKQFKGSKPIVLSDTELEALKKP